jgi:sugar lactone lactonase YvrE
LTLALLCGSCAAEEGPADRTAVQLSEIDTLVSDSEIAFERAIEVAVSRTGELVYVLDAGAATIHVFDSTGQWIGRHGRVGSGPGEFQQPHNLTLLADTLMVIDHGNGRQQFLTMDGKPIRTSPMPPFTQTGASSVSEDGRIMASTNGRDSVRAILMTLDGTVQARFGTPQFVLEQLDFQDMKRWIAAGEIPNTLRAITLPVLGPGDKVWLVARADAEVDRFSPEGTRLWTAKLEGLPEISRIRERFFELNRADSNENRFFPLDHVVSAQPRGQYVWLLLRMPEDEGACLVVLNADGAIAHKITIPGATGIRGFAVSPNGRTLYLLDFYRGTLQRATLPLWLAAGAANARP